MIQKCHCVLARFPQNSFKFSLCHAMYNSLGYVSFLFYFKASSSQHFSLLEWKKTYTFHWLLHDIFPCTVFKTQSHHGHQQTQQSKSRNQILKYVSDGSTLSIRLMLFTIREKPGGSYAEAGVGWVLFNSSSFLRMHWGSWKLLKCCVKRTRHPRLQRQSMTEHPGCKKPM